MKNHEKNCQIFKVFSILTFFKFFCFPSFFQFWRLITNFLFFGTIGFNFFFNMIFTYPFESINVHPCMFSNNVGALCLFRSPLTGVSKSHTEPMSHNVTPFFTDQFRALFRALFPHEKGSSAMCMQGLSQAAPLRQSHTAIEIVP